MHLIGAMLFLFIVSASDSRSYALSGVYQHAPYQQLMNKKMRSGNESTLLRGPVRVELTKFYCTRDMKYSNALSKYLHNALYTLCIKAEVRWQWQLSTSRFLFLSYPLHLLLCTKAAPLSFGEDVKELFLPCK